MPAPVLVLDVGGRLGLDDDGALAGDEDEKVDPPIRLLVRLDSGLGQDHAVHGFMHSAWC